MTALFTTARKATSAALSAVLTPLIVLLASGEGLTVRLVVVAVLSGLVAGVATWATFNEIPEAERGVIEFDEPGDHATPEA